MKPATGSNGRFAWIAAFVVKSLPLVWLRWLVVVVVLYAALAMLRSARAERGAGAPAQTPIP